MGAGNKPRRVELRRHTVGRPGRRLRRGRLRSPALELLPGLTQGRASPPARPQVFGQLVAARLAVELVLAAVRLRRLGQDLARDPLITAIGLARRVRRDLRPIDRHDADRHQPRPRAKPQHTREQLGQRVFVTHTKLRDRRVIRH
jgi:hypothetical protein